MTNNHYSIFVRTITFVFHTVPHFTTMKKYTLSTLLLCLTIGLFAQTNITFEEIEKRLISLNDVSPGNEDFTGFEDLKELLKDVDIVMLGEQSHGEATVYHTKIKLIKYLHQELGFDILAFESGVYDCQKAWELIQEGEDVRTCMGKSLFHVWSTTKELIPLSIYIDEQAKTDSPLQLMGFDSQFSGKLSSEFYIKDLTQFIKKTDASILNTEEWTDFENTLDLLFAYDFKELKKQKSKLDTTYINTLITRIQKDTKNAPASYWAQTLKSAKYCLSDIVLKTDFRDQQMADNLIWLREQYPNRKIICWGATSHFLYNSHEVRMQRPIVQLLGGKYYQKQPMMGHYIKEKYGSSVFTIGFTAHHGKYGFLTRRKTIKPAKENTLEVLLNQSKQDHFLLPLNGLKVAPYLSRPLGNMYMKNDIARVMDAVIFNREMEYPTLDRNFFLKIYPENKYIKPEPEPQP